MTLLEVMVAVMITSVVMSLAVSVVGTGVKLARQGEQTVNSNEAARTGMEMLLRDLKLAGIPGGLYVTEPGGIPVLIDSIFTQPNALGTGTDDLWLVVPKPNAMQSNCTSPGSNAVVTTSGTGPLSVNCTPFTAGDLLLVTNYTTAALISGTTFPTGTAIAYAESATTNFSSAPAKGGYLRGDQVFPVEIIRYTVRPSAMMVDGQYRPELVRSRGSLNTPVTAAAPFAVAAGAAEQRFPDIEDLQVAFGRGVAPATTFASAHNSTFSAIPPPIVSLRISVVGRTPRAIINDLNQKLPLGPITVEDHVPTPVLDGFRRSVYRRRVEILNMGMVNL